MWKPSDRGGRPPVGPKVETRLPEDMLTKVDTFATKRDLSRAEALRQLVSDGLLLNEASETRRIESDAIKGEKIKPEAIKSGDVLEDLRNGDPQMIEALILAALSRTTLNGMTDLGKDQARRFLDIYRQHAIDTDRATEK